MLALAAAIHWVYAGMALREFTTVVEPLDLYAWSMDVVSSLSRAFF
jgi:hypothetical protein